MAISHQFQNIRRVRQAIAWLFVAPCASACLEEAPTYEGQMRLPPYVVMASVIPNPAEPADVDDGTVSLEVPFRSEDLGQSVTAVFFVDSEFVTDLEYGPSVFSDKTRKVEQMLELDEGCHQIELILTHTDNLARPGPAPYDYSLAAYVYWWAVVPSEEGEIHCPR